MLNKVDKYHFDSMLETNKLLLVSLYADSKKQLDEHIIKNSSTQLALFSRI